MNEARLQRVFSDIAAPEGTLSATAWEDSDEPYRTVVLAQRDCGQARAELAAIQWSDDGRLEDVHVFVEGTDELAPDEARQLAATLIEFADLGDRHRVT